MSNEMKVTARPWGVIPPGGPQGAFPAIWNPDTGRIVADRIFGDTDIANAEFIVRACNAHDALLAACEEALGVLHWYRRYGNQGGIEYAIADATAAIAKAKGEAS